MDTYPHPLRRVVIVTLAAVLGTFAALVSAQTSPTPAAAASSIGGDISRSEVMSRATDWYNRRKDPDLTYDQTAYTWDAAHSRKYRRDCSGYVAMAWHLGSDPTTRELDDSTYTTAIDRADLKPGDILDDTKRDGDETSDQVIIFGGWEDSAKTHFWFYSFGTTPLQKVTGASFDDDEWASHPTSDYVPRRYKNIVDDLPSGKAVIYGALSSGKLTYSVVDAATGRRTHGAITSSASIGFVPTAMAVINQNTILATSPGGGLYRIDVITNNTSLTFDKPAYLAGGWTHDHLTYDGSRSLYGIADGTLIRYTITADKPTAETITERTVIGKGYTLKTLTSTGPDWLLGTASNGQLISYRIDGTSVRRGILKTSTWQTFDRLLSPGGGVYLAHNSAGALYRYHDQDPYDLNGADVAGLGAVDASGWSQSILSVQPRTVA